LEPNELYIPPGPFPRSLFFSPLLEEEWISGKSDKNPFLRFQQMKGIYINEKLAMAPFPPADLSTNNLLYSVCTYPQFTTRKRPSRAFQPLQGA